MKRLSLLLMLLAPVSVQAQQLHHQYFASHSHCMKLFDDKALSRGSLKTVQGQGIYCTCRLTVQQIQPRSPSDDNYYCLGYGRGVEEVLAGMASRNSASRPQANIYDVMIESLRSRSQSNSIMREYLRSNPYADSIMKSPNVSF
jgi:hypothetical protein